MTGPGIRHLRVLDLGDGLVGFYDGRVPGSRLLPEPNWYDDGGYALGTCSYALVRGDEALVFDTQMSPEHGAAIRAEVERRGARTIRVALSHWHLDHVAGTAAFPGCEVLASARTAALLAEHREAIEAGEHEGPPPIRPLVEPTTTWEGRLELTVGGEPVVLEAFEIHSADGTVAHLPERGVLLAADTVEDTATYVTEPDRHAVHLRELARLAQTAEARVLPAHGDPERIAGAGYDVRLVHATQRYLERLGEAVQRGDRPKLRDTVADELNAGTLTWFDAYERVHEENLDLMQREQTKTG